MKAFVLVAAMNFIAPDLTHDMRRYYAHVVEDEAARAHVDPALMAAIITHESRWHASADNGQCVGLGQICLRTQSACRDGLETPACQARRAELMDGSTNIHVMAGQLAEWMRHCQALTGHADVQHILSGYAGTDSEDIHCGQQLRFDGANVRTWRTVRPHKVVRDILKIYRSIRTAPNGSGTRRGKTR